MCLMSLAASTTRQEHHASDLSHCYTAATDHGAWGSILCFFYDSLQNSQQKER